MQFISYRRLYTAVASITIVLRNIRFEYSAAFTPPPLTVIKMVHIIFFCKFVVQLNTNKSYMIDVDSPRLY